MKNLSFAIALLTGGCVVYQQPATYSIPQRAVVEPAPAMYPPPPAQYAPPPQTAEYEPPPPPPVVSVYVEPPIEEPAPIAVPWAPPPMLVEEPPPPPFFDAVWIGGFWVWQGTWVWDHGRWAEPPRRNCHWGPSVLRASKRRGHLHHWTLGHRGRCLHRAAARLRLRGRAPHGRRQSGCDRSDRTACSCRRLRARAWESSSRPRSVLRQPSSPARRPSSMSACGSTTTSTATTRPSSIRHQRHQRDERDERHHRCTRPARPRLVRP